MQIGTKSYSDKTLLLVILIVAAILRLVHLGGESLWLDELHTMNEAGPGVTLPELFDFLKTIDQHPPLFFLLEHFSFSIFGYDEFGARIVPALAGIASVWGMYLLGKEILSKRLGLIAAMIACVNIYNIFYSQEARGYIFLWLLSCFSYLFFIRMYKYLKWKDVLAYVLSTVLLLYTHYFSLLVVFCQLLLGIVFWLSETENKKKYFWLFFMGELAVLICYIPWFPFLTKMSAIHSFWIGKISPVFFLEYFYEYFANATPFAAILIGYFYYVFSKQYSFKNIRTNPVVLSGVFIFISVFFALLIPYLRSVFVVPMLVSRYTIIVVPSLILCIAYGLELIKKEKTRNVLLALMLLVSLADVFFIRKAYGVHKEQFREMAQYISSESRDVPVINHITAWHSRYYFNRYQYKGKLIEANKEAMVDSILSGAYKADTFWLAGAHGDPYLDPAKRTRLDSSYVLLKERSFNNAWAQLFAKKQHK